jgi:hypothetical protein
LAFLNKPPVVDRAAGMARNKADKANSEAIELSAVVRMASWESDQVITLLRIHVLWLGGEAIVALW